MNEKLMFISAFQYNAIYSKDSGIAITTPVIESDKYEALQSQLDEANKVIGFYANGEHYYKGGLSHGDFNKWEIKHEDDGGNIVTPGKRARAYLKKYKEKV